MQNKTCEKWEEKALGEICTFARGLTYSKKDEVNASSNIVLRANNIDLEANTLNFNELKYINDNIVVPEDKKIKENTIMICISSGSKSHLGKVAFIDKNYNYAFGGFMGLIIPNKDLYPKFLYYMLTTPNFKNMIFNLTDGANINNLKYNDLKDFKLNIPTQIEQKRIVKVLDEAFENIDKAKQNAKQNLNNAKEFYDNFVNNIFTQNDNTWNKKTLEDLVSSEKYSIKRGPFGSSLTKSCFVKSGIRVFEQYNPINNNPYWARYYVTQEKYEELKAFKAGAGDLLVSCSGVTLGRIVELPIDIEEGIINQALLKIRLNNSLILNKFFIYLFRSKGFQNKIFEYSQGVAIPNMVGVKELKKIEIAFPSIEEQQKIVAQLDELQNQTKRLEQIYTQKIKDLEELKQSILQKAFNGEL